MADSTPRRPTWPLLLSLLLFALAVLVGRGGGRGTSSLKRVSDGTYENRRLGSTKRSLVVVTGKLLTGFDLGRGTEVTVDHPSFAERPVEPGR